MPTTEERVQPQNLEAEQCLLGSLLLDSTSIHDVDTKVNKASFYLKKHQTLFQVIQSLTDEGKPVDAVVLREELSRRSLLEEVGGSEYLVTLVNSVPTAANAEYYADIVKEKATIRGFISAASEILRKAYDAGVNSEELTVLAEQEIFKISQGQTSTATPINRILGPVFNRILSVRDRSRRISGVATGYYILDDMVSGLQPAQLIVIAGRPSMGKCLAKDSEIVLDDGSIATIEDVVRRRDSRVATLRQDLRIDREAPSHYVDDGVKPTFEVTTRLGRRVETTLTHPFLTLGGWKPLSELRAGDCVAVPRQLAVFGRDAMRECEIRLLAYLIGDGGLTGSSPRFTTTNPEIEADFLEAVRQFGGCTCTHFRSGTRAPSFAIVADEDQVAARREALASRVNAAIERSGRPARSLAVAAGVTPASVTHWRRGDTTPDESSFARLCDALGVSAEEMAPDGLAAARHNGPNAVTRWLRSHGLDGKGAADKVVPETVFRLPRPQAAMFLRHLFATDGWATVLATGQAQLGYASVCERLARQVSHLLLRFGVISKVKRRSVLHREMRRSCWQVDITDADAIRTFLSEIGIFGKQAAVDRVTAALKTRRKQTNTDLVPVGIWRRIEELKGPMTWRELARKAGIPGSNIHAHRRAPSRGRLARFAAALGSDDLTALASGDVFWDRIESIESTGQKQVYDLTIPGTHNFIANDVFVHNTSFALNIVEHVAIKEQQPCLIFSLEMQGQQVAQNMICSHARIDAHRVRKGTITEEEKARLLETATGFSSAPILIDDSSGLTVNQIRSRARRIALREKLSLIVIDYMQLIEVRGQEAGSRFDNRQTEISYISRSLKALSRELNVPVIALSQLNREVEKRPDHRPMLADLRESGAIEQDADVVLLLHRPGYYKDSGREDDTESEVIIAKQRSGPVGKVELRFFKQFTRFENAAAVPVEEPAE